jgi:phosphoribosylformylglycinamidine cyclo-ligase
MPPANLDVVGFVTGVVDRAKRMLTGANIVAGDVLYAHQLNRPAHQWMVSLARKLIFEIGGYAIDATSRRENLQGNDRGCRCSRPIRELCCASDPPFSDAGIPVKGMAHITGGGLVENVPRILPDGLGVVIDGAPGIRSPSLR